MRIELTITLPTLHLGAHVVETADVIILADVFPAEPDVGIDGPYCEVGRYRRDHRSDLLRETDMPKYDVTVYRTSADVLQMQITVEAETPEAANQAAIDAYGNDPSVAGDWDIASTQWAEDGWLPEIFDVAECPMVKP